MTKKKQTVTDQTERDFITGTTPLGLGQSLFVRAGAGAGKTHCLQERVKNLLLQGGLNPAKLAVITYTTKAAEEIKGRIRFVMEKAASGDDKPDVRAKAAKILDELNKCKISTVHSFCFDLLKEFPVEFGIDPDSQIADERQSKLIQSEVRRLFYEAEITQDQTLKSELAARIELNQSYPGSLSDDDLFSFFEILYSNRELKARVLPTESAAKLTARRETCNRLVSALSQDILINIEAAIEEESDKLYSGREEIIGTLSRYGVIQSNFKDCTTLTAAILNRECTPFPNVGTQGNYSNPKVLKDYKARVSELKVAVEEYCQESMLKCYNLVLPIYPGYQRLYDEFKRSKGFLDFADCLILLRNGLRDQPTLKASLQDRFDALIVDEFQDSDPLQSEILFHLAAADAEAKSSWEACDLVPGKLVFIGDPKQSIYGFARADIAIYLKVMKLITGAQKGSGRVLSTNFRSQPEIVEFVNRSFSKIIRTHETEKLASPAYEPMVAFRGPGARDDGAQVLELSLGLSTDTAETDGFGVRGMGIDEKRNREAWLVAKFIQGKIAQGTAQPGDFMLLFRKAAGMSLFEEALERLDVPVLNSKARAFLQTPESLALIAIMSLLVSPDDRHSIFAALRTLFLGYSDQRIQELFEACKDSVNLEALAGIDPNLAPLVTVARSQDPLPIRFENVCQWLGIYSNSRALGDETLLSSVINLRQILEAELRLNDYNEKITVEGLLGGALKPKTAFGGQSDDALTEDKLVLQTPKPSKVQLLTVHSSKGLESRYVILVNPSSDQMTGVDVLIDRTKEEIVPLEFKAMGSSLAKSPALAASVAKETIFKEEEEKRVLYVATTRAQDALYVVQYKDGKPGSFIAPLVPFLGPELPHVELALGDDYTARHKLERKSVPPVVATLTREELEKRQAKAAAQLLGKKNSSTAVTTSLKEEALKLFGSNQSGKARGKEFGTLTHEVMEWICHRASRKQRTTQTEAELALVRLNLSKYQFEDPELVELKTALGRFLTLDLYEALLAADAVFPEVPFQLIGNVHGVIDLLYVDKEGVHIVDWKSDSFDSTARADQVRAHYEKQINAYAAALEVTLGQKVASKRCVYIMSEASG